MTDAYVHVYVEPSAVTKAAESIAESDVATQVHLVTGEHDLVVQLETGDKEDIARAVTEEIHSVTGVIDTQTSVAFEL